MDRLAQLLSHFDLLSGVRRFDFRIRLILSFDVSYSRKGELLVLVNRFPEKSVVRITSRPTCHKLFSVDVKQEIKSSC